MGKFSGLVSALRESIRRDEETIKDHQSGRFWLMALRNGERVNINHEVIANAEARIAHHKKIIEACEKDDA